MVKYLFIKELAKNRWFNNSDSINERKVNFDENVMINSKEYRSKGRTLCIVYTYLGKK